MDRVKAVLKILRATYGRTAAQDFGPLALQAIQGKLVRDGKSRRYANHVTEGIVKRCFDRAEAHGWSTKYNAFNAGRPHRAVVQAQRYRRVGA